MLDCVELIINKVLNKTRIHVTQSNFKGKLLLKLRADNSCGLEQTGENMDSPGRNQTGFHYVERNT